jgi:beta-aspartyl-peptidase (threonine type)
VVALENDPAVNAGFGSVLNAAGALELDAGIADGTTNRFGSVAGVQVRNPISLARVVMEHTPHVMIAGAGANALASDHGLPPMTSSTPEQTLRWERARRGGRLEPGDYARPEHVDTVGAVALDDAGRLAAASSTGGVFGKLPGRVGDACVFGAGIYASPHVAVVGTGVGELFLTSLACLRAAELVATGLEPQAACEMVIELTRSVGPGSAGVLVVDSRGRVGAAYSGASWSVEGLGGPLEATRIE